MVQAEAKWAMIGARMDYIKKNPFTDKPRDLIPNIEIQKMYSNNIAIKWGQIKVSIVFLKKATSNNKNPQSTAYRSKTFVFQIHFSSQKNFFYLNWDSKAIAE